MSADTAFQAANTLALGGWVALLASPLMPGWSGLVAGRVIPLVLSVGYAALILVFWSRAEGGFGSLDEVAALFRSRELLLAGWVHYLAFDLFVGSWIAAEARRLAMPFALVVPILGLTFLFGPAGLLAFFILRAALGARSLKPTT